MPAKSATLLPAKSGATVEQGLRALPAIFVFLPAIGASISTGIVLSQTRCGCRHQMARWNGDGKPCKDAMPMVCAVPERARAIIGTGALGSAVPRHPAAIYGIRACDHWLSKVTGKIWQARCLINIYCAAWRVCGRIYGAVLKGRCAKLIARAAAPIPALVLLWSGRPLPVLLTAPLAAGRAPCPAAAAVQPLFHRRSASAPAAQLRYG